MSDFSSANLIYLISQPRSGSTMLQRILAGQGQIHTTAQPWLMLHPLYALRAQGHEAEYNAQLALQALQDFCATLPEGENHYDEALRRMTLYLYETATRAAGKTYFLDKTPRYYLILPELARLMPRARFILLYRNPLAVLHSLLEVSVKGRWILLGRLKNDLLRAPRLMTEAVDLLGERALVVHYETLVTEPVAQIAAIGDWLGLPTQPDMLRYGSKPPPPGVMGDPLTVHQYDAPSTDRLDSWLQLGEQAQTRHFAEKYLADLGPQLVHQLGYDYTGLQRRLAAVPCRSGKVSLTWDQLFEPDEAFQKRLKYAELALLEERRFFRWLGRRLKKK